METLTPKELAAQLWGAAEGVTRGRRARQIRRVARQLFPSEAPGKGGQWHFTPEQVAAIKDRLKLTHYQRMPRELTQRELRNESGEIMRALDRGEDFVITRNGSPVGELRPYRRRQFVPRDVVVAAFKGAPHIDYEEFRADIDAYVDQDPTPRG